MKEKLVQVGIQKSEKVGYFKSKFNLLQGTLNLTPDRLILEAHKTGVGGFGALGFLLKMKVEKKNFGFNLRFEEIITIKQGKQGVQRNILEITDNQDTTYRILVNNYQEWESELKQKMNSL